MNKGAQFRGGGDVEASVSGFPRPVLLDDFAWTVEVAPGVVRLSRKDQPWKPPRDVLPSERGDITSWSAQSRANLVRTVGQLDFTVLDSEPGVPAMVTLTLPGDWLRVAPDGAAFKAQFAAWRKRYERKYGRKWRGLWKLEFQRRGAPHLHLYMVVPSAREFQTWCSSAWADIVAHPNPIQRQRHSLAGTRVDILQGLRASDPKRLAIYFGKHSAPGGRSDKEYQHIPPAEWIDNGKSPGRFWGYIGIEKATAATQVSKDDFIRLRRIMRRWSRSTTSYPAEGLPVTRPRTAKVSVTRHKTFADGTIREYHRRVTRRRELMDTGRLQGGFVMVNDAPRFAEAMAQALRL